MQPRILLRTHYQADEPRIIIATVTDCASPTESRDEDAVAKAVVRWARSHHQMISIPGAVYAVGNARSLGLLTASNRWTSTGLAFSYLHKEGLADPPADDIATLTPVEERLYLRQYLIGGGALLIQFGQWLLAHNPTTDDDLRIMSTIEKLVISALDEYLSLATDIRDRTAIRRERDRLNRSDYVSSTKRHKRYPLLTTMERLRLLNVERKDGDRVSISPDNSRRLAALISAIPNVSSLERVVRDRSLPRVLDAALGEAERDDLPARARDVLLAGAYAYAMKRGLQACSLEYLDDVFYGVFPCTPRRPTPGPEELLDALRARMPGQVRFHVDRRGRRAFVVISDAAMEKLPSELSAVVERGPSDR